MAAGRGGARRAAAGSHLDFTPRRLTDERNEGQINLTDERNEGQIEVAKISAGYPVPLTHPTL